MYDSTVSIILHALGCELNRGQWFSTPDLCNLTGISDTLTVADALDHLQQRGEIEVRMHRPPGTYGRRFVRVAP